VRLAAGGAANVFLARDTSAKASGRLLALKVLLPNLAANEDFLKMFFTEAKIAARLRHDNIVQIAGFGRMGGIHSLAMEYVFGASLAQILRQSARQRKPLTVGVLLKIAASVCSALHYAHELKDEAGQAMGLVHRDVTPQNILIGFNGSPKLTDFGIAKAINRGWETQVGVVKGKFCYMSPEQALGKKVDRRSDIFGVGIVLWEALTGRDLFKGSSPMEVIAAIREQEIKPPSQVVEGLSPVVDPIVMRALRRSPRQRYQSALQMQQSIEALIKKAGVVIDDKAITRELADIFGDTIPKRALALRHAMLGKGDIDDLCVALNAQPLKHGHLPTPNHHEVDEEDPLGLFEGGQQEMPPPVDGITPLLPADPEQPFTAKIEASALQDELAEATIGTGMGDLDDLSDLSDLDFEKDDSSAVSFAPIDSWNDQTEMIEDHDELLELLSEEDLSQGKIPAVFTARFGKEKFDHINDLVEAEELITSSHEPIVSRDDTGGLIADVSIRVEQKRKKLLKEEQHRAAVRMGFEGDSTISSFSEPGPEFLLGEQLDLDGESNRPLPRAPSLDMDYDKHTPTPARALHLDPQTTSVPVVLRKASTTSPSQPSIDAPPAEPRKESGVEATYKEVPVVTPSSHSAPALPIVGTPLAREKTMEPAVSASPALAVHPKSEITGPKLLKDVPRLVAPVSDPTLPPLTGEVDAEPNMVRLRMDVLLLLVLALILFGIAVGLVIAKFIGLPTLT